MDSNSIYITDSNKWTNFFKKSAEKKKEHSFDAITTHGKTGRLGGERFNYSSHVIPIENTTIKETMDSNNADVNLVSPVVQTVEQAKLEIRREKNQSTHKRKKKHKKKHTTKKARKRKDNFD